jgi:hypothetical protein
MSKNQLVTNPNQALARRQMQALMGLVILLALIGIPYACAVSPEIRQFASFLLALPRLIHHVLFAGMTARVALESTALSALIGIFYSLNRHYLRLLRQTNTRISNSLCHKFALFYQMLGTMVPLPKFDGMIVFDFVAAFAISFVLFKLIGVLDLGFWGATILVIPFAVLSETAVKNEVRKRTARAERLLMDVRHMLKSPDIEGINTPLLESAYDDAVHTIKLVEEGRLKGVGVGDLRFAVQKLNELGYRPRSHQ